MPLGSAYMYRQDHKQTLRICDCGIIEYRKALELQHQLRNQRRNDQIPNTVLVAEHLPVITLGARKSNNKLLVEHGELTEKNIDLIEIRRGGGATAHNQGQLVFYPVFKLTDLDLGINEYVRLLEQTGIELLEGLGVSSRRRKGFVGLWVEDRKIASIGVRVSKMVTYHGMAINIQNDLSIFNNMVPCGIDGVVMTSVFKEKNVKYPMNDVKKKLAELLIKHFSTEELTEYETCS